MEKQPRGGSRLADAPSAGVLLGGSVLWAFGMMLSALFSSWLGGWGEESILPVALLFAAGGACAFAPALLVARFITAGRPSGAHFAASFLALSAATLLLTGLIYGAQHRLTFDEDHAPPFTIDWLFELAFSTAASFYRFALFGVSLYFPLGLLFLFAASFWNARTMR